VIAYDSLRAFSNAPEIAVVYLGLNDKNQAMAWLEKAYAEGFNPGVLIRPCFDPIRSDPGSKTCSAAWD